MTAFLILCIVFISFMTIFSCFGAVLDDRNVPFYVPNIIVNVIVIVGLSLALGSSC